MKRLFTPPRSCAEKPRWVAMSEQDSKERFGAFGAALAGTAARPTTASTKATAIAGKVQFFIGSSALLLAIQAQLIGESKPHLALPAG